MALLLVGFIPMLILAIAVFFDSGWPVLIRQRRIGQYGAEYRMWKFRTLAKDTPQMAKSELGAEQMRATRLGHFLRRYSLDELPQLVNVLLREMSIVGPRPALFTQRELIEMRAANGVLRLRPGLTGLAQVNGREDLELAEKVALDLEYARSMTLAGDVKILARTLGAVVRPRGSF